MKKSLLALLLAAVMLLQVLPMAAMAEGEVPTLKVTLVLHELTKDPSEIPVLKQLEEAAGVKLEFTVVRSGWTEKKATMLASGDLPDLMITKGMDDSDIAQNPEYFVPLNEYLDSGKMPNLSRVFEEAPLLKAASTQLDGKIYTVPSQRYFGGESFGCAMINKVWLDKLGLEVPTTLEDLKKVLIAFRDGDPNGNGIADEIPFDMFAVEYNSGFCFLNFLGCWGLTATGNQISITDDHQVVMTYTTEAFKKSVEYAADLWAENLINKEAFTQDYTMFQANAQNPEVPLVGFTPGWTIANRVGTQWADQYVLCAPFEVGDGTPAYFPTLNTIETNKGCIFSTCKDIDAAVRVLDACFDKEISMQLILGSIGDVFTVENGRYVMKEPTDGSDVDRYMWINGLGNNGIYYISPETQAKIDFLPGWYERLNESEHYNDVLRPADVAIYPEAAKMSTEDASELALLNADILNYVSNRYATWVTSGGVDEEWDSYLDQLKAMQVDRVREIYQNAYDNYMAATK